MKKFFSLLLAFLCMISPALADTPNKIPILTEDEIPATPAGIHNYMLLCVDSWNGKPDVLTNTDGMVLVTADELTGRLMLTSFIRDQLIEKADGSFNRLSRYVAQNGRNQQAVENLMDIFASHFGIVIDHYIVVDWTMIRNIIDAVGGVDITITAGEATRLKSKNAYKSSWTEPKLAGAGTYHFTGYAAVIYMRIRSTVVVDGEANDFRRTSRARSVLSSVAASLSDITYDRALELLDSVVENTLVTDMSTADLLEAVQLAFDLRGAQIEQLRIPIAGTYSNITYAGGACVQIDYPKNREALDSFLYGGFVVGEDEDDEFLPD